MKFDETKSHEFYDAVLAAFANDRPEELMISGYVGHVLTFREAEQAVDIHILCSEESAFEGKDGVVTLDAFTTDIAGKNYQFAVLKVLTEEFHALAGEQNDADPIPGIEVQRFDVGLRARGDALAGYGTFGWGFALDGDPCALSNWHVFCGKYNNTRLGSDVYINGVHAANLYQYDKVPNHGAEWDFAIAKFRDGFSFNPRFRPCDSGSRKPYPKRLAWASDPLPYGKMFYTVGARNPVCGEGKLRSYGSVKVKYSDGVARYFTNQLFFEKMTDPGDSGSIAVSVDTTEIWGLHFAGNSKQSISNPLYKKNWRYDGTIEIERGTEIPSYTTVGSSNDTDTTLDLNQYPIDDFDPNLIDGSPPPLTMNAVLRDWTTQAYAGSAVVLGVWKRSPGWFWVRYSTTYNRQTTQHFGWVHISSPNMFWPGTAPS